MNPCTGLNHPDVILIARDFLDQGIDRIKARDNFETFFRRGLACISLTSTSCKQKETEEQESQHLHFSPFHPSPLFYFINQFINRLIN